MRSLLLGLALAFPATGCAVAAEDPATPATDEAAFSPALGAHHGPFYASVVEGTPRRLTISYHEPLDSNFLLCHRFPAVPNATVLFVIGPENARTSVARPLRPSCPRSWGDNPGSTNTATFTVTETEDPELWDTLFPVGQDGTRWYAVEVAAVNEWRAWESRGGANYQLVVR